MKFLKNKDLHRPDASQFQCMEKLQVTVVLDNVRSGLNVGSVFRSADAFLCERIILCGITATPPDPEVLKTALGATQTVMWEHHRETSRALEALKSEGYILLAVEQANVSEPLQRLDPLAGTRYALVFGNEVKGIGADLEHYFDGCIEIPQSGTKHSLNISVCAGIVLWKFYEMLHLKP
jgi:tRNA G18 (ribose-2'-O)-methylase SpoU